VGEFRVSGTIALLVDPNLPSAESQSRQMQEAARSLGLNPLVLKAGSAGDARLAVTSGCAVFAHAKCFKTASWTSLPHPHRRRHFSHPVAPCTGSRAVNVCAARHTLFLSPSTAQCLIPVALLPCLVRTASCFTCTD
jgi:hypothetical protein